MNKKPIHPKTETTVYVHGGSPLEKASVSDIESEFGLTVKLVQGKFCEPGYNDVLMEDDQLTVSGSWDQVKAFLDKYFKVVVSIAGKGDIEYPPRWTRRYGSYQNEELVVISLRSIKKLHEVLGLIDSDLELKGMPWDTPDGRSLFVPAEAVKLLRSKGLKFTVSKLAN
ncbi:MAG: hypothetical protein WD898_03185 [Candidatus Paceibacterota bacterium]